MTVFSTYKLLEAYAAAARGEQALHLMPERFAHLREDTPSCFKGRGGIAHLFDQDETRLRKTAKRLGVRVVRVERLGQKGQHVDLCGAPLRRAMVEAGL